MRIAIIGTGISGLVAADRLRGRHDVTLFEAEDRVGGHTHTVPIDLGGRHYEIDTGFIVFNERNYPNFSAMLARLGVGSRPTSMSFGVRCARSGLEYSGGTLTGLFAQPANLLRPRFLGMLSDLLRFHREAPRLLAGPGGPEPTVEQWATEHRFGKAFLEHYLVPLGSCLWSCPAGTFRQFPIRFAVGFMANHLMLQATGRPIWRVVRGGSARYVERLVAPMLGRVRTRTPVRRVDRDAAGVAIHTDARRGAEAERFDRVVFACHADQALAMLADPSPAEAELLSAFPYEANAVTLHTDASVLPSRRRAWSSWNAHIHADGERMTATYNMNMLQGIDSPQTFCVTLNHDDGIDPAKVLGRYRYHHPIFTHRHFAAQRRQAELLDHRRSSYCGAYWGYGFHEDGVVSGLRAAAAIEAAEGISPTTTMHAVPEWTSESARASASAEARA
ncbi:MAG: FAD-dependent oxidoreductase [Planctomycetota bacterium]|nr:FAD-dependent oxidoreductase [Planctomycetota bacterium]